VVFPDAFERLESRLADDAPLMVVATMKGEGDHVELMADDVATLDDVEAQKAVALRVVLDLDSVSEPMVEELREYVLGHGGDLPVRLVLLRRGAFTALLEAPLPHGIEATAEVRAALKRIIGRGWSEFDFGRNGGQPRGRDADRQDPSPFDAAVERG
jgi:hypothetical protein